MEKIYEEGSKLKNKTSFIIYHNIESMTEILSDAELGEVMRAIMKYSIYRELPELKDRAQIMLFTNMKNSIDIDYKKWLKKSETNSQNGSMKGKTKEEREKLLQERKNQRTYEEQDFDNIYANKE